MAKRKCLKGVAHDIAHHAGSGLSYLSPHVAVVARQAFIETVTIDLLCEMPYPQDVAELEPLRLALKALHLKAAEILKNCGFKFGDLNSLILYVKPDASDKAGYLLSARTVVGYENRQFDSGWL